RATAGVISIAGSLDADVAIRAIIDVDEDRVLAPLLRVIKLFGSVRARIRRRTDSSAEAGAAIFFHRLIIQEHLLQRLKSRGAVHVIGTAVFRVVDRAPRLHARPRGHVAHVSPGWRPAVDVLAVAEFMIVQQRVIALAGEEVPETRLPAWIYRQKLFTILS